MPYFHFLNVESDRPKIFIFIFLFALLFLVSYTYFIFHRRQIFQTQVEVVSHNQRLVTQIYFDLVVKYYLQHYKSQ